MFPLSQNIKVYTIIIRFPSCIIVQKTNNFLQFMLYNNTSNTHRRTRSYHTVSVRNFFYRVSLHARITRIELRTVLNRTTLLTIYSFSGYNFD